MNEINTEKLRCSNGCNVESELPFFYSPGCSLTKLGVLADEFGEPSNLFIDGSSGVSEDTIDELYGHDVSCLHCISCQESIM